MEQDKFRCHFSIVFENLGMSFWIFLVFVFTQIDDFKEVLEAVEENDLADLKYLLIIPVVLLVIIAYWSIIWSRTWISIENDAIVLEKKTLIKKKNTIGMKNISNINMEQNLFERLIGTYKIKLDTNSKSTADGTDVKIVLSKEKALKFKETVMLHMNGKKEETIEHTEEKKVEYDITYSPMDIIKHCCYTASIFSVLMLIAMIIGIIVGIHSFRTGTVIIDSLVNIFGSILAIIFVAVSVIQSLIKDFFVYYDFGAKRIGDKIYLHHGLLKTREYAISVDKINAIQVVSPTVSRILGRQFVKVVCVGVGDEDNENSMILLSETKEGMKEKLRNLLPEFEMEEEELIRREKNTLFSELPGLLVCVIVCAVVAGVFGFADFFDIPMYARVLVILGSVLVALLVVIADILQYKTCGIYVGEEVLTLASGHFAKQITKIPYQKIQQMGYSQGPICRHFGYAMGIVFVLAQTLNSMYDISYFNVEIFEAVKEKMLLRKGNRD